MTDVIKFLFKGRKNSFRCWWNKAGVWRLCIIAIFKWFKSENRSNIVRIIINFIGYVWDNGMIMQSVRLQAALSFKNWINTWPRTVSAGVDMSIRTWTVSVADAPLDHILRTWSWSPVSRLTNVRLCVIILCNRSSVLDRIGGKEDQSKHEDLK